MRIFRRKAYDELLEWKRTSNGRSAVLVEGARRTGKTTLVSQFAQNEYESYLLINFFEADLETKDFFNRYSQDLDALFMRLQLKYGVSLKPRRSVVIFDEVQEFPRARGMIKHLVEDRRYDYIETGSLVSIKKNVKGIVIPSEERKVHIHPMDFEEFLWARGDEVTIGVVREAYDRRSPLGSDIHKMLMEKYTLYMLVGGMPQAVDELLATNDFAMVEKVKEGILDLYIDDSAKMDNPTTAKRLLRTLPTFLSKHEKTYSPSVVKEGSRTRDYLDAAYDLSESKVVNICYRSTNPGLAAEASIDYLCFKMYMADTGLLFTAMFRNNRTERSEAYQAMLKGRTGINRGMFFENMVAQELVMQNIEPLFSKFHVKETDMPQEVDFIIPHIDRVVPIEVKFGNISTRHASLDRFIEKYSKWTEQAYVIHTKDLRQDGSILYIPIYMTMFL